MMDLIAWMESTFGAHIEWKQVVLIGMTPMFLIAFAIEWQVMRKRGAGQQFYWKDILTNLNLGGSYQLFELAAHVIFVGAAVFWFWHHRFFTIAINGWTLLPIFLGVEFCYYWFHRCSHRVRWFWTAHVVHHSGEHMNMTTAMRQSLLYPITGWWLFFMPLVLLGVHPAVVFILYACDLVYQFFIHTESVGKLHPVLEYWFDTPSNHRAHHGRNDCYIDKNYGGVLIIFDRMFGTYVEEQEAVDYGIKRQVHSHNLLTLNFHEFIAMWRDVAQPGSLWQRLKHLWAPPEYERASTHQSSVQSQ
ncbi:sterol desaturase family protein [Glaciimonas soli]|nr:sterol desaturase family protein [Glaciimonas soli]